jgi:hypothetical protein
MATPGRLLDLLDTGAVTLGARMVSFESYLVHFDVCRTCAAGGPAEAELLAVCNRLSTSDTALPDKRRRCRRHSA